MVNSRKSTLKNILPPVLYAALLNAKTSLDFMLKADAKILAPNVALKNTATGKKRAFILATGPSIKTQDLSVLKGEDCFSCSNFFLHPEIKNLKPKLHFLAPYHPPLEADNFYNWFKNADEVLPPGTDVALGYSDYKEIIKRNIFANRKKYFLYFGTHVNVGKIDLQKPLLGAQTVPLILLPTLLYMGYEKIYLVGCDHTVLRDFKKTITHFFDPSSDQRKNASDTGAWKGNIMDSMRNSMNVFIQYEKYKNAIEKYYPGVEIINLSNDSWLDIFPFGNISDL